ncbi:Hypothetical protein PBC10988_25500 [Planctomycetales bacterium 10988]|nr:Hypothetical protein PBC10988_25500 [Planctomycetales bacterium 10988]
MKQRSKAFGDLVTRYKAGDFISVWQEIRAFEVLEDDLRKEVETVAHETMQRVAHNVDLLAARLGAKGWQPLTEDLRTLPDPEDVRIFSEIERITKGPIPTSLLAFWQVVGGVDLVWNYVSGENPPQLLSSVELELDVLDPLAIISPSNIEWQFDEWEDAIEDTPPELLGPFYLELAPDDLHKANISGGEPYGIELPFSGADPIFAGEAHQFPFVDYLRHCLRWGGFSHLEQHADEAGVSQLVKMLTAEFEPF